MSDAGRFQLLEAGQLLLPATCISCGSGSYSRKYVDLEISVDMFGQVYFCTECFSAIATDLLFVSKSTYDFVQKHVESVQNNQRKIESENEALKNVVVHVLSCRYPDADDIHMYIDQLLSNVLNAKASPDSCVFIPEQSKGYDESPSLKGPNDICESPARPIDESDSGDDSRDEE